ncbi:MAG: ketoacyl-ACP synthase III [Chitinophagales bacterium]
MPLARGKGIQIIGAAAAVPSQVFDTTMYPFSSEAERKDFQKHVGVISLRKAPLGLTASDMCVIAAKRLVKDLDWSFSEIELLIFVTQTPDYLVPFGAAAIQEQLGLSNSCAAFDLHLGCSGFVYGLSAIQAYLQLYGWQKALLLCGETSHIVSYSDKSTYPLIGDAGTATAIEASSSAGSVYFNLETFGDGYDAIIIPEGGARKPASTSSLEEESQAKGIRRTSLHAHMNGQKVLEFSLRSVVKNIESLLTFASLPTDAIDYFVFHQANRIICESLRKKIKIPEEKFPYSLTNFGNTSSASIPLTMITALRSNLSDLQGTLLLAGFGVGLSAASAIIPVDKLCCTPLLEI